jgi:hypothetical protein
MGKKAPRGFTAGVQNPSTPSQGTGSHSLAADPARRVITQDERVAGGDRLNLRVGEHLLGVDVVDGAVGEAAGHDRVSLVDLSCVAVGTARGERCRNHDTLRELQRTLYLPRIPSVLVKRRVRTRGGDRRGDRGGGCVARRVGQGW